MDYLTGQNVQAFLGVLAESHEVYVPVRSGEHRTFHRWPLQGQSLALNEVRTSEPLKSFLFKAREQVAEGFQPGLPAATRKPLCIVGAKACDLQGLAVQDFVFASEDDPDPFYTRARDEGLIIACDCTAPADTCFCLALDLKPYAEDRFDLNLSPVNGGYIVEVGSEKGRLLRERLTALFTPGHERMLEQRDGQRKQASQAVEENLRFHGTPSRDRYAGMVEANYESGLWAEEASKCVECGACNTICPTCHCFLLCDQKNANRFARFRTWDSCLLKDFARVAGDGNPRPKLWMRLRNRFEKKFDFFPKVAGLYACTGCGRCVSACPGKIDIRRVLNRLVNHA